MRGTSRLQPPIVVFVLDDPASRSRLVPSLVRRRILALYADHERSWPMNAVTDNARAALDVSRELCTTFRGDLLLPRDQRYETSRRVWNASIDRHPALIARCAGIDDVT